MSSFQVVPENVVNARMIPVDIPVDGSKPPVADPSPDDGVIDASDPDSKEPEQKPEDKEKEHVNRVQKRIDKLTREKYELKGRLDAYERMAQQQATKPQPEATPRPVRASYETDEDYIDAVTDWKIDQKMPKVTEQLTRQKAKEDQTTSWAAKVSATKSELKDYDDVLADADDIPVSESVEEAILTSDIGPKILYHLSKNPEEVERLNRMSPIAAARAIGAIEATLAAAKAKPVKVSKAPDPIDPVGQRGTAAPDLEKMSMAEFAAYEKERLKKLGRTK